MHLLRKNYTKKKLENNQVTKGLFLISGNSMIAETCSTLPLDWLIVDMEASPMTKKDALHILQSINGSDVSPFIRVPELNRHLIEHALDIGAEGVLVPKVETRKEAELAVEACYYPPLGKRGVNPVRASRYFSDIDGYIQSSNDQILCMVQIETAKSVDNVDEIADVEGVDVLFIGCGDLASSYGHPGDMTHASMNKAREKVLLAAEKTGKIPGIFAYSLDLARQYKEEGFQFIAIGNDIKAVRESVELNLDKFNK